MNEDGLWWACALELDVLGHGDTFAEALQCLRDPPTHNSGLQIYYEYAYVKNEEDTLPRRAEAKYWRMFYNASFKNSTTSLFLFCHALSCKGKKSKSRHIMRWLFRNPPLTPMRKSFLTLYLINLQPTID